MSGVATSTDYALAHCTWAALARTGRYSVDALARQ
jgi:hypothetical protein